MEGEIRKLPDSGDSSAVLHWPARQMVQSPKRTCLAMSTYIPVGIYKATIDNDYRIIGLKVGVYFRSDRRGQSINRKVVKAIALGAFVLATTRKVIVRGRLARRSADFR